MKRMLGFCLLSAGICLLASCAAQFTQLSIQASTEVNEYRGSCKAKGLKTELISPADSLYNLADQYNKNGKSEDAYYLYELSGVYYRLALSQQEVVESNERIRQLEQTMIIVKDKLDTYKKVLNELETVKQ